MKQINLVIWSGLAIVLVAAASAAVTEWNCHRRGLRARTLQSKDPIGEMLTEQSVPEIIAWASPRSRQEIYSELRKSDLGLLEEADSVTAVLEIQHGWSPVMTQIAIEFHLDAQDRFDHLIVDYALVGP